MNVKSDFQKHLTPEIMDSIQSIEMSQDKPHGAKKYLILLKSGKTASITGYDNTLYWLKTECGKQPVTKESIMLAAKKYQEMSCKPNMERYKVGYIIDEEKSVRWNREQVEENRRKYDEEVKRLNQAKNNAWNEIRAMIIKYIMIDTEVLTQKQAETLYDYAYDSGHSDGIYGIMEKVDSLCDFVYHLLSDK